MKKITWILIVTAVYSKLAFSQNIAPNPSFEEYEECPLTISAIDAPMGIISVRDWYRPNNATTDYYNTCAFDTWVHIPGNLVGYQYPRTGEAYAGLFALVHEDYRGSYREYLQGKLRSTLIAGHSYYVGYWVSATERYTGIPVDQMGAFFSEDYIFNDDEAELEEAAQITSPVGTIYKDTINWELVSGSFIAAGGENWVIIGNFVPESDLNKDTLKNNKNAYYYVDDICIFDVDSASPENIRVHDVLKCDSTELMLEGRSEVDNYLWDNGTTLPTRTISEIGTYWVRSIDKENCRMLVDTFHAIIDGAPIPTFSIGNDTLICIQTELRLTSDIPFDVGTYTWSNGAHDSSIVIASSGNYWLEIRDGCYYRTDTINVLFAPASLDIVTNDTTVCQGAEIPVTAIGNPIYDYEWIPGDNVSDPSSLSPIITVNEDGSYFLKGSYEGCPDTIVAISFETEPVPTVNLPGDTGVCVAEMVLMEPMITPPYDQYLYKWYPASGLIDTTLANNYFLTDTSITYYLEVRTPIGCRDIDSIYIEVFPPMKLSAIADTGICPGDTIMLWATGGHYYTWNPGEGLSNNNIANPIAIPESPVNYEVYVKDIYGCSDTLNINLDIYPNAVLSLPDSINIYPGEAYQISPESNCLYYSWFPPSGLSAANISNPLASPEVRTRYFVTVGTERGCIIKDSIDILVQGTLLDMPNAFVPGNGSNNMFKPVKRGIAFLNSFQVFNRWGNKVYESKNIDEGWDGTFNGKPQPMGTYIYIIDAVTDAGKPFIKQGNVLLIR